MYCKENPVQAQCSLFLSCTLTSVHKASIERHLLSPQEWIHWKQNQNMLVRSVLNYLKLFQEVYTELPQVISGGLY